MSDKFDRQEVESMNSGENGWLDDLMDPEDNPEFTDEEIERIVHGNQANTDLLLETLRKAGLALMIRTSEQTEELMVALASAQGKFGAAIKNAANPAFRSKYADLSSIIDATLEHLNAAGVVVMQHPALAYKGEGESREAFVTVTTRLQLKSQWIESDIDIPAVMRDRFDAQSTGSAITYGCRYALQSILVVPREDDDGNKAVGMGTSEAAQKVASAKIASHRASKGSTGAPEQLTVVQTGEDAYDVAGEPAVMEAHKGLLLPTARDQG